MGRVPVLREVGVELHGVAAEGVEFGGEGVEVADYAFEFVGEGAMFGLQFCVLMGSVGVGVAEGFDLSTYVSLWVDNYGARRQQEALERFEMTGGRRR
jgi:hypothetical protein